MKDKCMKKFDQLFNKLIRKNAYSASRYLYKAIKIDKDKIIDSNIISEGIEF